MSDPQEACGVCGRCIAATAKHTTPTMSTVDIDTLRYTITYEVDKELLCDQATIDSDFNGSWQEWLNWFAKEEMAEVMVGMDTEPLSIKVGDTTTHLKAELLAKSITVEVPDDELQDMVKIEVIPAKIVNEL